MKVGSPQPSLFRGPHALQPDPKQMCAGLTHFNKPWRRVCEASADSREATPACSPRTGLTGAFTRAGPGRPTQRAEGGETGPPHKLHSSHPDDTLGGRRNGPARTWVLGTLGLCRSHAPCSLWPGIREAWRR